MIGYDAIALAFSLNALTTWTLEDEFDEGPDDETFDEYEFDIDQPMDAPFRSLGLYWAHETRGVEHDAFKLGNTFLPFALKRRMFEPAACVGPGAVGSFKASLIGEGDPGAVWCEFEYEPDNSIIPLAGVLALVAQVCRDRDGEPVAIRTAAAIYAVIRRYLDHDLDTIREPGGRAGGGPVTLRSRAGSRWPGIPWRRSSKESPSPTARPD